MRICFDCDITYKLRYCCGINPETNESVRLELDSGETVSVCPNLDSSGICVEYFNRPEICSGYECPRAAKSDLCDLLHFD